MEEFISEKATRRQQYDTEKVSNCFILFTILLTLRGCQRPVVFFLGLAQCRQNAST